MNKFEGITFVAFDTETTGFKRKGDDRIVEVAAIKFRLTPEYEELDRFVTLANPGRPIPEAATKIHGITDEMVASAPPIGNVILDTMSFAAPDEPGGIVILLAHNAPFDLEFVEAEVSRQTLRWDRPPAVCTYGFSRLLFPEQVSHKLEDVVARYRPGQEKNFHRALEDTEALVIAAVNMLRHPRVASLMWLRSQRGVWFA